MAKFTPAQAVLGLLFAPQVIQGLTSLYPPFSSGIAKKAYSQDPNLVPPPSELIGQRQKKIINDEMFINLAMQGGYSPKHAENMLANARTYLAALDYITAWRRGELEEVKLNEVLSEQGLTSEDITTLKSVTIYYPTPQDLIRFAIRDVYTTQTIEQYGLFEDYPDQLDAAAIKAGLPPEITKLYWGAHWELPSATECYDMYHRKIITKEQLETFLKVADFMPFWRDKLIQLSYDNITRVDIRRIYGLGLIDEDEMTLRYEKLGYSPDDAALLTQFTVAETKHSGETTAKSVIVASYKAGTIDRATALQELGTVKIPEDLANTYLDNADANIRQEIIDLEADAIANQFQQGHISLDEFQTQLTKIGVPARTLQLTIERELAQARKRSKTSTKSDLDAWWKMGVIGHNIYRQRMSLLGYSDTDISMYISELMIAELSGADKKFPWGDAMRAYSDGDILGDGLESMISAVVKDPNIIGQLLGIAKSMKG